MGSSIAPSDLSLSDLTGQIQGHSYFGGLHFAVRKCVWRKSQKLFNQLLHFRWEQYVYSKDEMIRFEQNLHAFRVQVEGSKFGPMIRDIGKSLEWLKRCMAGHYTNIYTWQLLLIRTGVNSDFWIPIPIPVPIEKFNSNSIPIPVPIEKSIPLQFQFI